MYKKLIVLFLCAALLYPAPSSLAGPKGGKVVGGNANISQSGSTTTINQTSNRAIINWNSFDINKNESVRHNMPSSNSAGLHRVVGGGGASQIAGSLQSNGNVYIVNPAGVVIHNGAKIDVNGFVATSRDITDQNFMKGNMVFDKPGLPDAAIINKGNISLKDNGLAVLVAPTVRNDGIIAGKLGKVALGGSEAAWKLDMTGDDLIAFTLDEKAVNTLHAADGTPLASVENNGQIKAEGGVVVMSAAQLDGFIGSVVNNGEISAASVESKGGKIIFRGEGNKVDLKNSGSLDVSSQSRDGGIVRMSGKAQVVNAGRIDAAGAKGGKVILTGKDITLKTASVINASGTNGGGTVLVGGNARGKGPEPNAKTVTVQKDAEILASAKLKGDGGQVVVWADEKTQFDGRITATGGEQGGDGGFIETSAKLLIIGDPAVVNTSAKNGKAGKWLMDPEDFVIAAANGDVSGATISKNLEFNDVVIEVSGDGEGNGDIIVNDEIKWSTDTTLTLNALRDIIINSDITLAGNYASLIINTLNGDYYLNDDAKVFILGNSNLININNDTYKVIHTIRELQNIDNDLDSNYVLGNEIDASETISWNDGEGFKPIGDVFGISGYAAPFTGSFEGFGHNITNLYIHPGPINDGGKWRVGLFKWIYGYGSSGIKIQNLNLVNSDISSLWNVGSLAGEVTEDVIIKNISCSGKVDGVEYVGGLIGSSGGKIIDCHSDCTISSNIGGGLIGEMYSGEITKSYFNGSITGEITVGGLVGSVETNIIVNNPSININNSFNKGEIIGFGGRLINVGGFIGEIGKLAGNAIIENCYNSGKISIKANDESWINVGGFIGTDSPSQGGNGTGTVINCYWDITSSTVPRAIGHQSYSSHIYDIKGLTTKEMMHQSSFKNWDFQNIWKIDEGKGYPELRGIANNNINFPVDPVEPTPPDNPDPVLPDPVDPDPAPVDPDPINPAPVDPTPTEPDPVQPKPEQPAPSNPDPVTPIEPAPTDPTTPVQPSNPQPSQPTPTQPTPSNPGTPSQPINPAPSTPATPSTPTPSQPTPSVPVTPSNPQTPSSSSNGNLGGSRPTIHYIKDNGNLHVYKDNVNGVTIGGSPSLPASGTDHANNIYDVYEYDPYTATPEERQAFIERIERERAEEKAKYDLELEQAFEDAKRNNFPNIVNRMENTVSNEMDSLSDVVMDLYTLEMTIMAAIFSGEKISGSAGKITNFGATAHNSLKTIWGTLMGNGWGDQLRAKKYMQALITKDFMALYMLTIANNARKRYDQVDSTAGKLQLLCQMELATKISESITSDYNDLLYYFTVDAGKDGAKDLINELVIGKVLDDKYLTKVFQGDKTFAETLQPDTFETIKQDVALTKQLSKGIIGETKVVNNFLDHIGSTSRDDSIEGMVNRLMHSSDVNTIITDTMNKYNKLAQEAGLDGSYPDGKMSFNQDIRDCWNWDPEIATSLNNVFTADLPGAKIGNAIKAAIGPTLGSVFGIKPKKEQLSNLYSAKTVSAKFSAGDGGEDTAAAANGER